MKPIESPPGRRNFRVMLIATYEMGRQPFGLASPAAWLKSDGFDVTTADVAVEPLPQAAIPDADFIAFYLPMHTATRLAGELLPKIREANPTAKLCCYGLYAPLNGEFLRGLGVHFILGGEFEADLRDICRALRKGRTPSASPERETVPLPRLQFKIPDRRGLPELSRYARLVDGNATEITGYTEASRGCKHRCRHCPVVPVYQGRFRIVQIDVVLADIRQQVEAGAGHITFGDPDFFNGIGHAMAIVRQFHRQFPETTYDVTIKVEHLLRHREHLAELRRTGCRLITTAVESFDNEVLKILDKGHTFQDFKTAAALVDHCGIALNPTFIPFTPWMSLTGYSNFLKNLWEMNLIPNVSPVQMAIRLLVPRGSLLLPAMKPYITGFNSRKLSFEWKHPDSRMDRLQAELTALIAGATANGNSRPEIFRKVWELARDFDAESEPLPVMETAPARATVPYLNEPWYC